MRTTFAGFVVLFTTAACAPAPASRDQAENTRPPGDSAATKPPVAAAPAPRTASPARAKTSAMSTPKASATKTPKAPAMKAPPARNSSVTSLVGIWDINPSSSRGPRLSLAIDSVKGSRFFGRLTRALSGDMELSANYRPFTGTLGPDGVAQVTIQNTQKSGVPINIAGHLKDSGSITSVVWGEELVTKTTAWTATKGQR